MIQQCIEANRAKFTMYAKVAMVIGWVLLIFSAVFLLPCLFKLWRLRTLWYGMLQIITPAFFGMFFLVLGQFLKYELGLEKQPGWFFRKGYCILRCYAAVIIAMIVLQYAMLVISLVQKDNSFGRMFLSSVSMIIVYMSNIIKVLLLWGLAGAAKMMMGEIYKKEDVTADNM